MHGTVRYPLNKDEYPLVEGKYHVCGGQSTVYWIEIGISFEVCGPCAVEKLPLLIADAIGPPRLLRVTAD